MEAQAALVGADGAVELAAVAGVGVHLAVIIGPHNTEGEHSLGLYHAAQEVCLFIFGVLIDQRGDGAENLLHGLNKFGFVLILASDVFDDAFYICIHGSFSFWPQLRQVFSILAKLGEKYNCS